MLLHFFLKMWSQCLFSSLVVAVAQFWHVGHKDVVETGTYVSELGNTSFCSTFRHVAFKFERLLKERYKWRVMSEQEKADLESHGEVPIVLHQDDWS